MTLPKKQTWQERIRSVLEFHIQCIHRDKYWTVRKTAKELNRSVGSVSQDINLAYFIRSHPKMEEFRNYVDALEWMRSRREHLRYRR